MDLSTLNFFAIFVAALSSFIIGGLWYSPFVFGKAWMAENGFKDEDLQGGMGKTFALSFVLSLIIAFNLAAFLGPDATLSWGLTAGALAGIGWVATAIGITYLFERKSMRLFLINAGYHAVTFTLMGGILGLWR
jgi:hypothetical protein